MPEWSVTKSCCEVWSIVRSSFGWMVPEGAPDIRMMPFIAGQGIKYRVNHCPGCGAERSNSVESAEEMYGF